MDNSINQYIYAEWCYSIEVQKKKQPFCAIAQ